MWHDLLEQGIQAAQAGDKQQADQLLTQTVRENPDSSEAWLWLGKVLDDPERKRFCFDKALQLDSSMIEAWLEMNKIKDGQPSAPAPFDPVPPPAPAMDPLDLPDAIPHPVRHSLEDLDLGKPRRDLLMVILIVVTVLLGVGLLAVLGFAALSGGLHL